MSIDIQSELDRKAVESLNELVGDYENKRITLHAYLTSLTTLNNALRGLVDNEVMEAIDQERNRLEPIYLMKLQQQKEQAA